MLNELIEIASGFQSSVNISYDLKNDEKIKGFIPTSSSLELIGDILASTAIESTQRAKILTGAYGRGKSHIILVVLSLLYRSKGKNKKIFKNLLERMNAFDEDIYRQTVNFLDSNVRLLPVIINGNSSSLTQSFINALQQTLSSNNMDDIMPDTHFQAAENTINKWKEQYPDTYDKFVSKISIKPRIFIESLKAHDTKAYQQFYKIYPDLTAGSVFNPFVGFDVAEIYEQVSIAVNQKGYSGLFIVYDEFGKYLESSITTATESDTKLLQDLAEKANRSGKNQIHLMLICHKDISNYIDMNLPQDKVDGWRGISGRFEHINLHNNYSQMYEIIAAVIEKNPILWGEFCSRYKAVFDNLAKRFTANKLIGSDETKVKDAIISCYPLHPSAMYILPRLSEKVAQNERTLFTFLSANQKNTLVEFIEQNTEDFPFVTPDYLYDYFETQFKKELNSTEISKVYKLATKTLKKVKRDSIHAKIIKTIALIYIIEQFEKLPPTVDTIIDIFIDTVDDPKLITEAISYLVDNACIVYLKRSNNYLKLKETSGIDINEQINTRVEKLKLSENVKTVLNTLSFDNYLYPVKYNDEHSITRYFEFRFVNGFEASNNEIVTVDKDANGLVQALFFNSKAEFDNFDRDTNINNDNRVITIIPKEYEEISSYAYMYKAVCELKSEVVDDEVLSDEYSVYLEDLETVVHKYISGFTRPEMGAVEYYHLGKRVELYRKAQLSALLSSICEASYPYTPLINNESLNKNTLPTVAINSRTKLTTALLESEVIEENLGLSGTGQDVSFMRSTLIQTGILTGKDNQYRLETETADENMKIVLKKIQEFFTGTSINGESSFADLYYTLTSAECGIGLKRGVIPVYIAVVLIPLKKDIIIRYKKEEVKINSDTLNSINENPQDYSAVMENWNEDKSGYLHKLEELFRENIVEREKSFNSFAYIAYAMNRWYMTLPRCAKEMTVNYFDGKTLSKEHTRFINALKQPTNNNRELLMVQLPKIFGSDNASTIIADSIATIKIEFELAKEMLLKKIISIIKDTFDGEKNASISSIFKDWYETLKPETIDYQYPNSENMILSLIADVTNDEKTFAEQIAKAIVGLRIDDWNSSSVEVFAKGVLAFKQTVETYNNNKHDNVNSSKESYKFVFTDDKGKVTTRIFERVEYSNRAKLLYNDITGAIEDMGQSINEQEKRQILIEILEGLCK